MIPILYEQNETAFSNLGIGGLSDAISCKVVEERNGSFEITLQYPVNGMHYSEICIERIILAYPSEGANAQPFRIYKISKPLNGVITVKGQHISYDLSKIVCKPFSATSCSAALNGLMTNSYTQHNFTTWTDKNVSDGFRLKVPASIRSILGGVTGSILDVYNGGEYEFDGFTVKLHAQRGADRGVTVLYGKNLTGCNQDQSSENVYTAVVPYWSDDNSTVIGSVVYSGHQTDYGRTMIVPMDLSSEFDDQPTTAQLESKALSYMTSNSVWQLAQNIRVQYVPDMGEVKLCDTVTVYHESLGISLKQKVLKTTYDVLNERYDSIEIGTAKQTSLYSSISQQITSNQTYTDKLSVSNGKHTFNIFPWLITSENSDGDSVYVSPGIIELRDFDRSKYAYMTKGVVRIVDGSDVAYIDHNQILFITDGEKSFGNLTKSEINIYDATTGRLVTVKPASVVISQGTSKSMFTANGLFVEKTIDGVVKKAVVNSGVIVAEEVNGDKVSVGTDSIWINNTCLDQGKLKKLLALIGE